MIIACPACSTRYVVPDTAIGLEGRTVRCAKCRESWFQDGPELVRPEVAAKAQADSPPPVRPTASETPLPPLSRPEPSIAAAPAPHYDEPPLRAPVEAAEAPPFRDDDAAARFDDDGRSSFDFEPPFRPRRNPAKMWTMAASLFAVTALAAVGAVAWYGLPDWAPLARPTFAEAQPDLVLDFPPNRQDRRTLPNGTAYFGASGTVTNVGQAGRAVPTILIVLRDKRERIVYSWEVVPPKRQLAPGESVTINEAVTDVPRSAASADIGWKPG